jgi:hypothetical protein
MTLGGPSPSIDKGTLVCPSPTPFPSPFSVSHHMPFLPRRPSARWHGTNPSRQINGDKSDLLRLYPSGRGWGQVSLFPALIDVQGQVPSSIT